tara:strand:- start:541 stop:1026 length:486 start_codon:yes stop_codon:yes gene_type:complete
MANKIKLIRRYIKEAIKRGDNKLANIMNNQKMGTKATVGYGNGNVHIDKDGHIAALDIYYSGDFSYDSGPEGWIIEKNNNRIILLNVFGTDIKDFIFKYEGSLKIHKCLIATLEGRLINAIITHPHDVIEYSSTLIENEARKVEDVKINYNNKIKNNRGSY